MACLYARAREGDSARKMLRIFADNFCSVNSFHLNGDQKGGQYSGFTYRPFTLEGNFAFAQGIQEMLLQSDRGFIEIFPAIPGAWKEISFTKLRAAGAFLISASRQEGSLNSVKIFSQKGGWVRLKWAPKTFHLSDGGKKYLFTDGMLEFSMQPGEEITIQAG
jgi:alpha-L-fucosidase 2